MSRALPALRAMSRALPALSCGNVDLGIARPHFELGANAVSRDWTFEAQRGTRFPPDRSIIRLFHLCLL